MMAEFLHRNPRVLLLLVSVIALAGVTSWFVLPQLEDPVLSRRVGVISTVYPAANARQVESLLTRPLEESLTGLADIRQVRSNSQSGISNIVVELQDDVYDVDTVWSVVRDRISDAASALPEEIRTPKLDILPLKAYAAIVAIEPCRQTTESNLQSIRNPVRELRGDILDIDDTAAVDLFGDPGEEYSVEIRPAQLASLNTSVISIAEQIRQQHTRIPAGRIPDADALLPLTVYSEKDPPTALEQSTIMAMPRGEVVLVKEIATVRRQLVAAATEAALIDGQPALVLGAMVDDKRRIDAWAEQLQTVLADFADRHASALTVRTLFSQSDHVEQRMQSLVRNLGIGVAAVTVVVFILMGWRCMLVVSTALPLSSLMVLTAMRLLDVPIHQMSVTGLIVALGLLIDNAIIIVEDVRNRILDGQLPSDAVIAGVRHLRLPLFGSTLTTTLAFLPIAILPGPPGEFVGTIAVSVILAISSSFVLAMTVVPAIVSLLRIEPQQRGFFTCGLTIARLQMWYAVSLRFTFRYPALGILAGIVFPAAGFLLVGDLPEQFFPTSDRLQIQIEVELPARESLAATRECVEAIRRVAAENSAVRAQNWFIGRSAPTFYYNEVPRRRGTPFYAQAFVDLQPGTSIEPLVRRLQTQLDSEFSQSRILVRQLEQGPPFDAPVEVRLLGPDIHILQRLGTQFRVLLLESPHVLHTRSDLEETVPSLEFNIDEQAAAEVGMTAAQVAVQLYTSLEGAAAGSIPEGEEAIPIRVRLVLDDGVEFEQIAALPLATAVPRGSAGVASLDRSRFAPVTLGGLSEAYMGSDVGAIVRINGRRANEVKAYIHAGVLPSVVIEDFKRRLAASWSQLPEGYTVEFGGEAEQRSQAVERLIANGVVLVALMLLTLVLLFGSFRCTAIIAAVGGLSIGLGPLALASFGYPLGFMAIVGTMGLVGVAINDSIVVLAAIRASPSARGGDLEGLITVVIRCTRHVVATTLTTIAGFLPLILGGGGFWPPLAVTVAGGVGGATLLALYMVPAMHRLTHAARSNK